MPLPGIPPHPLQFHDTFPLFTHDGVDLWVPDAAERELASTAETAQPLSETEIRALVTSQGKILRTLARATPEQRATIYSQTMGLRITCNPEDASIEIEARPACTQVCVGGGTPPLSDWRLSPWPRPNRRFEGSADVGVPRQRRLAVVRVTTSALVTTPPKSFRMNDSISSSKPTRSDSSII